MLQKSTTDFLSELATNNRTEWLSTHKELFETSRSNVTDLIESLVKGISKFDDLIASDSDSKLYLMRLNRDTRFSSDKRPYKTNFGVWITPLKNKGNEPAYYLHIEPGKSYLAGALWSPDSLDLAKIRKYLVKEQQSFLNFVEDEEVAGRFNFDFSTALKKVPKDFPADVPVAEFLKLKTFVLQQTIDDNILLDPFFVDHVLKSFKTVYPLLAFFRNALQDE